MTSALRNTVAEPFCSLRLERVFNQCFSASEHTRLIGGAAEPLYQPGADGPWHHLYYREDYFASALHESAHWCIAGRERRQQLDFGYWYAPEGRSAAQQQAFEAVEIKPQALEWFFAQACGYAFGVSVDNFDPLTGSQPDSAAFKDAVFQQALRWQQSGLPARAEQFFRALSAEFATALSVQTVVFRRADLDR